MAQSRARLLFATLSTACDKPEKATHSIKAKIRPWFVEITDKWKISQCTSIDPPIVVPYTSDIGTCIEAPPQHVQRLFGDILALRTSAGWDHTEPVESSVATDGSVTFGVGYHRWVIATADEDILI
jgi:hypothetical protein